MSLDSDSEARVAERLERSFFERSPVVCARELVGCLLEWGECVGRIVETEAYAVEGDDACHTAFRPSARAFVEKHPAGVAYVYLNYGMHWMLNVLIKSESGHGFVLLRALEPQLGVSRMESRRKRAKIRQLCSGPGKLAQALGVTGADHGRDLCGNARQEPLESPQLSDPGFEEGVVRSEFRFWGKSARLPSPGFFQAPARSRARVLACPRIGIQRAQELPWRFVEMGSPWLSVPPP